MKIYGCENINMKERRSTHFEPQLIDLFIENLDEVYDIQDKYKD